MSSPLSLTGRRWIFKHQDAVSGDVATFLASKRSIDPALDASRTLSDPFLFSEMEKAVARIEAAMLAHESIAIFGDYDADGITGTAQLVRFFRRHGIEPVTYLPHRVTDGYGLKHAIVDGLKAQGVSLLMTVDTGIAAHKEIEHANSHGIDVIVTDHHRVQGGRPPAFAVIHPQIPNKFPNEHLSGSGVAFMLVRALEKDGVWKGIDEDIALAAIGTIGDVVPLTGENRTLVLHGLKFMSRLPASPLKDLLDSVRAGGSLTSGDIAFRVVPRINAAGRMAHPQTALDALLVGGDALEELHRLNGDRQTLVEELLEHAEMLTDSSKLFLTLFSDEATPGTVGLIAGRLTERFGKPSIVGAKKDDVYVCSLRSVSQVDVMKCLEHPEVRSHLVTFGGHAQAAGCTVKAKDTEKLSAALQKAVEDLNLAEPLLPTLFIDAELPLKEATIRLAKSLLSLAPFGEKNPEPLFHLRGCTLQDLRTIGSENSHLQCKIGATKAVGFRLGHLLTQLSKDTPVDLACRISINAWNGREDIQIVIEDVRPTT